jgi:hypothetical protein
MMTQTSWRRPLRPGGVNPSPTAATPGPAPSTPHRQLARDIRSDRIGEVMAKPAGIVRQYWLRPVGGGREWDVPKQFVQLLDAEAAA